MTATKAPPIIDQIFQAIVTSDSQIWADLESAPVDELLNIRALICTDNTNGLDLGLKLDVTQSEYVVPIFEGPRFFCMSRHTTLQSALTGGRSNVPIDYSLSFDSNFAEKLRAVVNDENVSAVERCRVLEILSLKAHNEKVQFDLLPFLIENTRLAREDGTNQRPFNTLLAFRMLDHLDWDALRLNPGFLKFKMDKALLKRSLAVDANEYFASLMKSPEVAKQEARALTMQALLLKLASLWHKQRPDPRQILGQLLDYCIFELGSIPVNDLCLIWTGISGKERAPFFGPILGKSKDMLVDIRGMAWDMTHLRLLERLASSSIAGSFYVPYFVSFDKKWRKLLRSNPVSFMLFDDLKSSMLVGRANELSFQLALSECRSKRADGEFSQAKIEARRLGAKSLDTTRMKRLIAEEEIRLCST